jgi:hypothetical protein
LKVRHRILSVGAVVTTATLLAVGAGTAKPALAESFHTSHMTKSFTPWLSTTSQGAQYWTVSAGTTVSMRCWNTGKTVDGTGKWFWITSGAYPYTQGYVPANDVGSQWQSSPHC